MRRSTALERRLWSTWKTLTGADVDVAAPTKCWAAVYFSAKHDLEKVCQLSIIKDDDLGVWLDNCNTSDLSKAVDYLIGNTFVNKVHDIFLRYGLCKDYTHV